MLLLFFEFFWIYAFREEVNLWHVCILNSLKVLKYALVNNSALSLYGMQLSLLEKSFGGTNLTQISLLVLSSSCFL
jgi:hypothetical protein